MLTAVSHPFWGAGLILLGLSVALHGLWKGATFEPLHLFFCVHPVALGASLLELLGYRNGFSADFLLIVSVGYATFFMGGVLAHRGKVQGNGWSVQDGRWDQLIVFLGILGIFAASRIAGGWPMLANNPGLARLGFFGYRAIPHLFELGMLAAFVASGNLILQKRWIYSLPLVILFLEILLTGNRGQLLQIVLFSIALLQLKWKRRIFWPLLIAGGLFVVVFLLVGFARSFDSGNVKGLMTIFSASQMIYSYLCNGYWNFGLGVDRYLDGLIDQTWGTSVGGGLWFWLMNLGDLQKSFGWDPLAFNESIVKYNGLNSATYMWAMIKDFGIPGMLLMNFAYGYGLVWLYRKSQRDFRYALVFSYLVYQIVFSFNILWSNEGLSVYSFFLVVLYAFSLKAPNQA